MAYTTRIEANITASTLCSSKNRSRRYDWFTRRAKNPIPRGSVVWRTLSDCNCTRSRTVNHLCLDSSWVIESRVGEFNRSEINRSEGSCVESDLWSVASNVVP